MSSKHRNAILIFSKALEPGTVKTRLRPMLTDTQCLSLHLAFLQDTVVKCRSVPADTFLYLTGAAKLPFSPLVPVLLQSGRDLGERMRNAFADALQTYERVLIVGTDSPTLSSELMREALDRLSTHEVVLGPCEDGGYYLIALKHLIPEPFSGIPWGTSEVLPRTLSALTQRRVHLLKSLYDVDQPEDLHRLKHEIENGTITLAFHTQQWLKSGN